jgi:hypothetical protein
MSAAITPPVLNAAAVLPSTVAAAVSGTGGPSSSSNDHIVTRLPVISAHIIDDSLPRDIEYCTGLTSISSFLRTTSHHDHQLLFHLFERTSYTMYASVNVI